MKYYIFTTATCGPCFALKRRLQDIKHKGEIIEVNDKKSYALAKKYGIRHVPRLVVDDGKNVEVIQGSEDIVNRVKTA